MSRDDSANFTRIADIDVRPARLSDGPRIAEFNRNLAKETEDLVLDFQTVLLGVEAALIDPNKGQYWIAEIDGQVVGQAQVTFEWSDWRNAYWWWIQSVYTDEVYRRRGVFRALYAFIERRARQESNVVGLRLYVERDNHAAKQTYLDLGMVESHYNFFESSFI